jgi:Flp pilus assembly protein TadG
MRVGLLRRHDRHSSQRGSMAIELVLLTPLLVGFTLLVVAGGRFVGRQSDVDSAARDAARAASIERTEGSALAVAQTVADASLPDGATCQPAEVVTNWPLPGSSQAGSVRVTITCDVSYSGLGFIGLPGSATLKGTSVAPLDQYRRTE